MQLGALLNGKYRLIRQIGEGSMGVVWAAVNEATSKEVALKLILRSTEELRYRLEKEAHAAGGLKHRNVIEIYDVARTAQGDPFLVMPLLSGETLSELLERQRRLAPEVAAWIARDVARALEAAHAGNIVHRDLKPANIFLHQEPGAEGPVVKVLDFGVSKNLEVADGRTVVGTAVGSPAYMSPEQARADRTLDHRADLWSLGVVLFEMLTGVRPFRGDANEILRQIVVGEIPLVSRFERVVDPALVALVSRCLQRDRDERIGSAAELVAALERFVSPGRQSGALGPSGSELTSPLLPVAAAVSAQVAAADGEEDEEGLARTMKLDQIKAVNLFQRWAPEAAATPQAIPPQSTSAPDAPGAPRPEMPPPSPPPVHFRTTLPISAYPRFAADGAGQPRGPEAALPLPASMGEPPPNNGAALLEAQKRRRLVALAVVIGLWMGMLGVVGVVLHSERSMARVPPSTPTVTVSAAESAAPSSEVSVQPLPPPTSTPTVTPALPSASIVKPPVAPLRRTAGGSTKQPTGVRPPWEH